DSSEHGIWYYGQALIAPSLTLNLWRKSMFDPYSLKHEDERPWDPVTKEKRPPSQNWMRPEHDPPFQPAFGKTGEQGVLFTALATTRPLLHPLRMDPAWLWLVLPMVLAVAIVYKAIKLDDLRKLPLAALWLATQILAFMTLAAAVLWVLTEIF